MKKRYLFTGLLAIILFNAGIFNLYAANDPGELSVGIPYSAYVGEVLRITGTHSATHFGESATTLNISLVKQHHLGALHTQTNLVGESIANKTITISGTTSINETLTIPENIPITYELSNGIYQVVVEVLYGKIKLIEKEDIFVTKYDATAGSSSMRINGGNYLDPTSGIPYSYFAYTDLGTANTSSGIPISGTYSGSHNGVDAEAINISLVRWDTSSLTPVRELTSIRSNWYYPNGTKGIDCTFDLPSDLASTADIDSGYYVVQVSVKYNNQNINTYGTITINNDGPNNNEEILMPFIANSKGNYNLPDSVLVENITQGTTITLNGNDTLYLTDNIDDELNTDQILMELTSLKVYPNPAVDKATVEFYNQSVGKVNLAIYNAVGVQTANHNTILPEGKHSYELLGLNHGVNVISITTNTEKLSSVIVSQNNFTSNTSIKLKSIQHEEVSTNKQTGTHKAALAGTGNRVEMVFNDGDSLKFTAYLDNHTSTNSFKPIINRTVSFYFEDRIETLGDIQKLLAEAYFGYTHTWESGFSTASLQAALMGSDDLTTTLLTQKSDFREFDQYSADSLNYRLSFIWDGCYKAINYSNLIIDNYLTVTGSKDSINNIAGEAHFLRAYSYFWIARLWETAPLLLHEMDTATFFNTTPSATQALYNQILIDLDSAISLIADSKIEPGRASKASAVATKAEVYLQMAGWPLNQTDKYALAASTAKDLIDNQSDYGLKLLDTYDALWLKDYDGNPEEVFALTYIGQGSLNRNNNSMYGISNFPDDVNGWADFCAELSFFNNYPDQARKNAVFLTEFVINPGPTADTIGWDESTYYPRPFYKKFTIPDTTETGERKYSVTWENDKANPLERFAEVYLIYAEAQIMATGNNTDTDALEALNIITRRAWGEDMSAPGAHEYTTATQAVIVQEKAWEFAGEFCRWFDICRLQMLDDIISAKDANDHQPINTDRYWLPVPANPYPF